MSESSEGTADQGGGSLTLLRLDVTSEPEIESVEMTTKDGMLGWRVVFRTEDGKKLEAFLPEQAGSWEEATEVS